MKKQSGNILLGILEFIFWFMVVIVIGYALVYGSIFDDFSKAAEAIRGNRYQFKAGTIGVLIAMFLVGSALSGIFTLLFRGAIKLIPALIALGLFIFIQVGNHQGRHSELQNMYRHNDGPPGQELYFTENGVSKFSSKKNGEKVTDQNLALAYEIDKVIQGQAKGPAAVDVSHLTFENINEFQIFENGNPKYFKGSTLDKNNYPRLYSSGVYDPLTGDALTKFTSEDLADFKHYLMSISSKVKWREIYEVELKKEEQEAKVAKEKEESLKRELSAKAEREAAEKAYTESLKRDEANRLEQQRKKQEIESSRQRVDLDQNRPKFKIPEDYEVIEMGGLAALQIGEKKTLSLDRSLFENNNGNVTATLPWNGLVGYDNKFGYVVIKRFK